MVIFLILGMFMDWTGIVLLVMPVFMPIVLKLPVQEIGVFAPLVAAPAFVSVWFGVLFCVNMQVSFLSPPFGPAAFYLKSVAPPQISLQDIFRGFMPFIGIQLIVLTLVLFFPELTMLFR
jgi:TRAP-type mannitol/chloroaromatic compound transport system permease large subunit